MNELKTEAIEDFDLFKRLIAFANWLEAGVVATDDPMLKHVEKQFAELFKDYLQKVDSTSGDESALESEKE